MEPNDGYDKLAWFYDRYWDRHYHAEALRILDRLVLNRLPRGARILDLCCGAGHLALMLAEKGFRVTGIDRSEEMLACAARKLPEAGFIRADARAFRLQPVFTAAVSTFESISHILEIEGLLEVFGNTHAALKPGGFFAFDINTEEAYLELWHKSSAIVESDHICIVRGGYDPGSRTGRTDITLLRLQEGWHREDIQLLQRAYSVETIRDALEAAGFREVAQYDASRLGMQGDQGIGRVFFRARKLADP